MKRLARSLSVSVAAAALVSLAAAGCGSPTGIASPNRTPTGEFVGYRWTVVAIAHAGRTTAIPAGYSDSVFLLFTPNGEFIANEPVNTHGGTYRVTDDGFVTSDVGMTLVGYLGNNPIILLSEKAIGAFNNSTQATATVAGNRLTVVVDGYTLTCQRDGKQGNLP